MYVVRLDTAHDAGAVAGKRPYHKPTLTMHGDVRDLTLGGSPGTGESANPGHKKPKRSTQFRDNWLDDTP